MFYKVCKKNWTLVGSTIIKITCLPPSIICLRFIYHLNTHLNIYLLYKNAYCKHDAGFAPSP